MSKPRRIAPKPRPKWYVPPSKEERRKPRAPHDRERIEYGWGDWMAWALAKGYVIPFVKMTPRKWRQWKVSCGLSGACGCTERKIGLNKFGRWVVKPFRRLAASVRKWWKALPPPAPPAE